MKTICGILLSVSFVTSCQHQQFSSDKSIGLESVLRSYDPEINANLLEYIDDALDHKDIDLIIYSKFNKDEIFYFDDYSGEKLNIASKKTSQLNVEKQQIVGCLFVAEAGVEPEALGVRKSVGLSISLKFERIFFGEIGLPDEGKHGVIENNYRNCTEALEIWRKT